MKLRHLPAAAACVACVSIPAIALAQSAALSLKVAVVQYRSSFNAADNGARIAAHLERLAKVGVRVAVFPEAALTGYRKDVLPVDSMPQVAAAEERIRQTCRAHRIAAVVGSLHEVEGRVYNTAVVFSSSGELVERYGKLMLAGEKWATPGNHIAYFDLEGVPSTVLICHDERYPELVRLPAIAGARVAYYISHESGMRDESKLEPYRAQLMARAVENQIFVVASNAPANTDATGSHGQSRIIRDDGNILKEASFFGEDTLIETLSIAPRTLERPLSGLMGQWWRRGLELMTGAERSLDTPLNIQGKSERDERGFVPLFDGKTLNGWSIEEKKGPGFVVENGVLVCPADGGLKLVSDREYGNFDFRFEFKLAPDSNNGIGIRAPRESHTSTQGIEIQILDQSGPKYGPLKLRPEQYHGSIYDVIPARTGFLGKPGEWNEQEITADGRRIAVRLNGAVILDADLDMVREPQILQKHPGLARNSGHIILIGHGSRVEFRNLRIRTRR